MIGDNPAARLLDILERGTQENPNSNCREVWRSLLNVTTGGDSLLMARLGKVMELPQQIIELINQDFPNQQGTFAHWNAQVHAAFSSQNLNSEWNTFRQHLDKHSIAYLRLTADLIQTKSATTLLSDDTIHELKEKIDGLLTEVLASDLSADIKKILARYLQKLSITIDEYRISGAQGVMDTIEGIFGHAFFDENYRKTITASEIGKTIVSTLATIANCVTVAIGAPQIPQSFTALLDHLK